MAFIVSPVRVEIQFLSCCDDAARPNVRRRADHGNALA
jgi:hypothetical protein